jgi:hypothetical protein
MDSPSSVSFSTVPRLSVMDSTIRRLFVARDNLLSLKIEGPLKVAL